MAQQPTRPIPVEIPPGYVKVDSPLSEKGRFIDGFGVRFFRGKPQKIGGFVALLTAAMLGIVRGLKAWNDLTSQQWIGAGTTQKLYASSSASYSPQDITPFVRESTAANPFTTTNGSNIVNVAFASHLAVLNQNLIISGGSAVGGLTLAGEYQVTAIVDNNNFQITAATPATSGVTGGGAAVVDLELPPGLVNPASGFGWGAGGWNQGTWNTPRSIGSISFDPLAWSLGNFGKLLLAAPLNGSLYVWDPTNLAQPRAIAVTGANPPPSIMSGFFTTAEGFVIAFGTNSGGGTQDLMQLHWCAQNDYTDWSSTELTGTIGSPSRIRRVRRGRRVMNGVDIGGFTSIIWTDSACYRHTYTGSANVFDTQLAGVDCGLIGPNAFVVVGNTAYWMSAGGFFMSEGGATPVRIPAQEDISEWVFRDNLRDFYSIKTMAWYNPRFDEVWFAFASKTSDEPDLCAVFNRSGFWVTDRLVRTAATRFDGQNALPILAGTDGMLYQHEIGVDANGAPLPWSLTTALFELDVGAISMGVESFYPDMERHVGTIALELIAYDRSVDPPIETETGTFGPGQDQVDFRIAGRELSMTISGGTALGDDFRLGIPKVEITDIGSRG